MWATCRTERNWCWACARSILGEHELNGWLRLANITPPLEYGANPKRPRQQRTHHVPHRRAFKQRAYRINHGHLHPSRLRRRLQDGRGKGPFGHTDLTREQVRRRQALP